MAASVFTRDDIDRDVLAVGRIAAVPSILEVLRETTGLRFAAIARVTESTWTACAVQDSLSYGLAPGSDLDIRTTLCWEVREAKKPIAINHASRDPVYCEHHTPEAYGFESYVSVPIVLPNGRYFGSLCALDTLPADVNNPKTLSLFKHLAHLIALELDNQGRAETVMRELVDEKEDGALREQFIAVLGHDLRNPLSSISASAHVLKLKSADPMVVEMSERIGTSVRRMTRLIEDLLDFARGRLGGGMDMNLTVVADLPAAIDEVIGEFLASHPGRVLRADVEVARSVRGDRARLQQLLSNLIANALTHGAVAAPVAITASTDDERLELRVHNEGEPIPQHALPGIFDAYKRQGGAAGRSSGLGLGLFICEQIVRAHGGELTVTSTAAEGTTFRVLIPLVEERQRLSP